jgi:paraquat-inducible protein B
MNEEMYEPDSQTLPLARVVARGRWPVSWIWIVPAIAVLIALGLVVRTVIQRGPELTLQMASAEGLEANKTKIKYKDVEVGTVTAIALSGDRRMVKVTAAMNKQAEALLVDDSRFWVVRPRIGAGGVSGLTTLMSGAYIAIDPGKSPTRRSDFVGLETPPLVVSDMPGRQFLLAAEDLGSIDVGVPIYFRRVPVGRVVGYVMHPDGRSVDVRIFVDAPFDHFVTRNARFWHASGIDLSLAADGMKVEMQSLVSLAVGGIAFSNVDSDADAAADEVPAESKFALYSDRQTALRLPDGVAQNYVLIFNESVRGLAVGSPVDFRGLSAGEVSRIDLDLRPGSANAAIAVEIKLFPERLARLRRTKSDAQYSESDSRKIIDSLVGNGLRAQLRSANLLTGQNYVALDFFPKAKAAGVKWGRAIPELPTQPGAIDSLQNQLQGLMETLQKTLERTDRLIAGVNDGVVPELMATLREAGKTLQRVDSVLASVNDRVVPELTATLGDARKTLQRADSVLASDSPTQLELRDTLREVGRAAAAVRDLAELLERQPQALLTGRKESQ